MTTSSRVRHLAGVALATGVLLALFAVPAFAAEEFGIVPGSFTAGTFQSDGITPDTQAGDHPYEATTSFAIKTDTQGFPEGFTKDVAVNLPPGLVGDPNATPRCSQAMFTALFTHGEGTDNCPNDTQVGQARVEIDTENEALTIHLVPVFNLVPSRGQLAMLGFQPIGGIPIFVGLSVRDTGNDSVNATVANVSQASSVIASTVSLWGVPADPSHDAQRGLTCLGPLARPREFCEGGGEPSDAPARPFLRNPTACDGSPLTSTLRVDSWEEPGLGREAGASSPALEGCEKLVFDPSLSVTPETSAVDTPTGLQVDLHVPQSEDPYGLGTPDLRDATISLPAGMAISPSAANGLEGCTPEEIGLHTEDPVACPDRSKLGIVHVTSPDLPDNTDGSHGELTGAVYLGAPASGPITAPPYTIYLVAEGYDVSIRLEGTVSANPTTGQLTTTFTENPPVPFEDLKLDFFGGPRAALMTPPACGSYTATSQLVPYSSLVAATPSSSFATSSGGGSCPSPMPFGPSFSAGATNTSAGGFSSFVLNLSRPDGQQALSRISLTTPPGLLGKLSSVPLCGELQAAQGICPQSSKIGTATAGAGAGSEPFYASGSVYLTGPYRGAPFGLSLAIPAVAGPFNFGTVIVRSAIYVDPQTAQITVLSDPLPLMIDTSQTDSGVPVALQSVSVDIDRPGFIFNPTSCDPMSLDGALISNEGASEAVSSPFQVGGCAGLPFKPSFTASTQAKASKADGASLDVKVASGPGQANIAKVDVSLPDQLPSRLTTLQKACTEAQFAASPAGCPDGSIVGVATAVTPVLNVPLTGPAILVSHGGAAFPDLVVVLQGQGVTIELTGETEIKNGVTYSKFETVPDAPVSSFDLQLPESPHSILGAYLPASAKDSFCGQNISMPTTITGQNGAVIKRDTQITVTGCSPAVKIAKITGTAKSLLVTLDTTVQGTITLTGTGTRTTSRRNLKAGTSTIQVPLTSTGQAMRAHHAQLHLHARLTTGKHAVANTASVKL
jgi:hypothetical protein